MFTQRAFLVRERERVEQAGLPAALVELVQLVVPLMPAGTVNTEPPLFWCCALLGRHRLLGMVKRL